MKIASVAEIRTQFSAYLKASQKEPVIVTRNGKPVAVLVAVGGEEELSRLASARRPKLRSIVNAARRRILAGQGIPHKDFWEEMAAEKRAQQRSKPRKRTAAKTPANR